MKAAHGLLVAFGLLLVACYPPAAATPTPPLPVVTIDLPSPSATPDPTPSPTPIPLSTDTPAPSPSAQAASPETGCVNGWISLSTGSPEFEQGLAILEGHMGISGPWTVTEMRYFSGPDVPWIIEPHYDVVERWYVRATVVADPAFRGRWLVEQRTDTIKGVAAVAPYDSFGYESPDWTGFYGEGPPTNYLGLPGQWSGIAYDFVTGEGDSGQPGLPAEVVGCLQAT